MTSEQYTVEEFLKYVQKSRAKNTLIMYREGLKRFTEWYGKTANEVLQERLKDVKSDDLLKKRRYRRKIEEFHRYLIKEKAYTPNSANYYCQGIRALFSFYEVSVKVSREIQKKRKTTRDFVPRIDQYAAMSRSADNLRDKVIVSMGLTLGWRISDFAKIRKDTLPNLDEQSPIPFEVITEKEQTIAKSFLSDEVVELLKQYIPTLSEKNPYLFPSNGKGNLDHTTFNRIVRELAEKADIKMPKGKRIRFHCFRKRFYSEAANLRINVNIARLLVGKAVEPSELAYLSEVNLREAFLKISERLRLTEKKPKIATKETSELEKRLERLERKLNLIAVIYPDAEEKANEMLKTLGFITHEQIIKMTFNEKLDTIVKEEERKQQEEYDKLIAENNNNER